MQKNNEHGKSIGETEQGEFEGVSWPTPIPSDLLLLFHTIQELPKFYKVWMSEQARLN